MNKELPLVMPCMECNCYYVTQKYGEICPYCGANQYKIMEQKEEEANMKPLTPDEFVCGFIVRIQGVAIGNYFRYYRGKNPVGYGQDMTIKIKGEKRDYNRPHFLIMFDDRQRETLLLPGESRAMIYLNDVPFFTPERLYLGDIIGVNDERYYFRPICGEEFMWDFNKY